jgi:hypothetical protein
MQFFGIVLPNLSVRLFLLRKVKDQKPEYMIIRTLSELLGIQSSEPLKRHLQSFSDEELLFVQSCAGILNLFMALRKAMLTMKSRFPKGVQSKIPPMRTPKDTQRFSSPRCAMEDSYRH